MYVYMLQIGTNFIKKLSHLSNLSKCHVVYSQIATIRAFSNWKMHCTCMYNNRIIIAWEENARILVIKLVQRIKNINSYVKITGCFYL